MEHHEPFRGIGVNYLLIKNKKFIIDDEENI
jgi:hypothetical protein